MHLDPKEPSIGRQRRSIRLNEYDYAQAGGYFVTVVAYLQKCRLGEIAGGRMMLNLLGKTVQACWEEIPVDFPDVDVDEFVVMPNHIHGRNH